METKNNMMCDLETGVCGPVDEQSSETGMAGLIYFSEPKQTVDLYYVTDPICSHCWALEPVLRKFIDQYGEYVNMHTVMGGLLEKWEGFSDAGNGISKPGDVASHWREVGVHTRMPIDGTVWYDDPIESSYIPSRVYKVIQKEHPEYANTFLRRAREALFAFNQNIAQDHILIDLVNEIGLDGKAIVQQSKSTEADNSLRDDFALVRQLGVRGFPTIVMVNDEQKGVRIVGARSFNEYVNALKQLLPNENVEPKAPSSFDDLLQREKRLFSREIEEYYSIAKDNVEAFIQQQIPQDQNVYKKNEILGEMYVEVK